MDFRELSQPNLDSWPCWRLWIYVRWNKDILLRRNDKLLAFSQPLTNLAISVLANNDLIGGSLPTEVGLLTSLHWLSLGKKLSYTVLLVMNRTFPVPHVL
jgi:hypothetical protein